MNISSKPIVTSTIFLKATSLIIGFLFWSLLSDSFTASTWVTVPVCFYNATNQKIACEETIKVELKGKRAHLRNIKTEALAVHIDAQQFRAGPHSIMVTSEQLLLPPTIAVGETIPHVLMINIAESPPLNQESNP